MQKAPTGFVTSVRLSTCIRAAPHGQIFVKFDVENFYEKSQKFKFRYNWSKIAFKFMKTQGCFIAVGVVNFHHSM